MSYHHHLMQRSQHCFMIHLHFLHVCFTVEQQDCSLSLSFHNSQINIVKFLIMRLVNLVSNSLSYFIIHYTSFHICLISIYDVSFHYLKHLLYIDIISNKAERSVINTNKSRILTKVHTTISFSFINL